MAGSQHLGTRIAYQVLASSQKDMPRKNIKCGGSHYSSLPLDQLEVVLGCGGLDGEDVGALGQVGDVEGGGAAEGGGGAAGHVEDFDVWGFAVKAEDLHLSGGGVGEEYGLGVFGWGDALGVLFDEEGGDGGVGEEEDGAGVVGGAVAPVVEAWPG